MCASTDISRVLVCGLHTSCHSDHHILHPPQTFGCPTVVTCQWASVGKQFHTIINVLTWLTDLVTVLFKSTMVRRVSNCHKHRLWKWALKVFQDMFVFLCKCKKCWLLGNWHLHGYLHGLSRTDLTHQDKDRMWMMKKSQGDTEGTVCVCEPMKVIIEEWSENSKDEKGHWVKNEPVDRMKIEAFYHEICKTVRFVEACNDVGNSMMMIAQ